MNLESVLVESFLRLSAGLLRILIEGGRHRLYCQYGVLEGRPAMYRGNVYAALRSHRLIILGLSMAEKIFF